jgi:hypothetical protein
MNPMNCNGPENNLEFALKSKYLKIIPPFQLSKGYLLLIG